LFCPRDRLFHQLRCFVMNKEQRSPVRNKLHQQHTCRVL
jgi:hypothetical protein